MVVTKGVSGVPSQVLSNACALTILTSELLTDVESTAELVTGVPVQVKGSESRSS